MNLLCECALAKNKKQKTKMAGAPWTMQVSTAIVAVIGLMFLGIGFGFVQKESYERGLTIFMALLLTLIGVWGFIKGRQVS